MGGGHSVKQSDTKLAGIQIQTSCYGGAVALVYGTDRIAANLIHYLDFKAIPHTKKQKMGKGGGGSMSSTTYTYEAMILLAICEGVVGVNRVWKDKSVTSLAGLGFTFFSGSRTQAPWAYLTSKHPAEAVGYAGTAYAAHAAYELDGNASLENHSFEVTGFCAVGGGNLDAHPADIVPHYLSDPLVGAGWDASRLGDLALYRTYCTAAGLWLSPSWSEQAEAKRGLEEIFTATNSEPVWSEGKLKVIPYGDTPLTGNGVTYTPNTTPVYDLTLDDFLAEGDEDPIQVERTSTQDAYNCAPVKFRDRALEYNENTLDDPDPVDVETFGPRKAEAKDLPCIKRAAVALTISRILAQRSVYCRNRYRFRLGWRYCLLEPMDLVTLTAPYLGLDHRPVRLLEIEENEQGDLDVTAEEWPFGVASHTRYTVQSADGQAPDVNADPGDAAAPVVLQPPLWLCQSGGPELWLATSGGDLWGGCEVWVSADGATYSYVGSVHFGRSCWQPCRSGRLQHTGAPAHPEQPAARVWQCPGPRRSDHAALGGGRAPGLPDGHLDRARGLRPHQPAAGSLWDAHRREGHRGAVGAPGRGSLPPPAATGAPRPEALPEAGLREPVGWWPAGSSQRPRLRIHARGAGAAWRSVREHDRHGHAAGVGGDRVSAL